MRNTAGPATTGKHLKNAVAFRSNGANMLVLDVAADQVRKTLLARQTELLRACGVPASRPTADNLLNARVRSPFDALNHLLARDLTQRGDHLVDANRNTRQI